MCSGGRLVADMTVGTTERPDIPGQLESSLTPTADGRWVLWARKLAVPRGAVFYPLAGGNSYPADAIAKCGRGRRHRAPDPRCTCGFHALSSDLRWSERGDLVELEVALSGRVLAFEWGAGDVLFRAERQTVARRHSLRSSVGTWERPPDTAGWHARVRDGEPAGSGPIRLALPSATPPSIGVTDDIGLCVLMTPDPIRTSPMLVPL